MINIGIIGHRNLYINDIHRYQSEIFQKFKQLKQRYKKITLYSSLADGSDRLVIQEALKLDIGFITVLPMEKNMYEIDFSTDSQKEFNSLLDKSKGIITMSHKQTFCRDTQYEDAGYYISDSSDILFALWDGKYNMLKGGTSETVKYHLNNNKKLWHIKVDRESI